MVMRIGRTLPPAAAPFNLEDIMSGVAGFFKGQGTVKRFENELKSFYKVRCCFAASSGKAALVLILQALHEIFPDKDEVLIPAYTCYSVPSAIVRAGCRATLCDMAPGTLDFDFDRLRVELENPRLLCVISTHLFGVPADVGRVKSLIGNRNIFVVEDAAQAMGGVWNGVMLGTAADAGLFSLGRGKAFSTAGGGVILTDNAGIGRKIEKQLESIAECGFSDCMKLIIYAAALSMLIHPWIYWLPKSLPFLKLGETRFDPDFPIKKLSSFQAGIARGWKARINALKAIRSSNSHKIIKYGITPAGSFRTVIPDMIRFPFLAADKETKRKILLESEQMGLGITGGYPDSIDGIKELGIRADSDGFPTAKDIVEKIVCLPVHQFVRVFDIRRMVQLLG